MRLWFGRFALVAAALSGISGAACGDDASAASDEGSELEFRAEASALGDFSFDTGLVPPKSPAQISLKLAAGGKTRVVATGTRTQSGVMGKPGGGTFSLDLHATLAGRLKIDTPLKKADEELPGLKNIDVPIAGDVTFDPFLVEEGQTASLTATVPETKLPPIPLGSIPGKLELTITKDSKLDSRLRGRCVSVTGEQASYQAEATTRGSLVLKGTILVELPAPLNAPIDIGTIDVPIPEFTSLLDSAIVPAPGFPDTKNGSGCTGGGDPDPGGPLPTDGGAADATPDGGPAIEVYRGTRATTSPVAFGGGSFCGYSVVLRDIEVTLSRSDGRTISGSVKNGVLETLDGSCPYPAAAPSKQSFELVVPTTPSSNLAFAGAPANQPAAMLAGVLVAGSGGYEAQLRWKRYDVEPELNWEVSATVPLQRQ